MTAATRDDVLARVTARVANDHLRRHMLATEAIMRALAAYRSLMTQAIGITRPGGILALSSCSSHVTADAFLAAIGDASAQSGRRLRVLEVRGQPVDHPTLPAFPEGRYLKFVIARKV